MSDGVWRVIEGPEDISIVLERTSGHAREGEHIDQLRLREAHILYPNLETLDGPTKATDDRVRLTCYVTLSVKLPASP